MAEGFLSRNQYRFVVMTLMAGVLLIFAYLKYPTIPNDASAILRNINFGRTSGAFTDHVTSRRLLGKSDYELTYIPEEDALKLPACIDHKLAADLKNSKISIQDSTNRVYRLGDTFSVLIQMYDGYGKPLTKGGAILRARMFNMAKKAFATSHMTDNGNGSYTAVFEASWTGKSTIKVQINYTPETIRAIYYIRRKLRGTRDIEGLFSVGQYKETTLCHPTSEGLRGLNYSQICNLTGDNSGMPWYCGKPNNIHLLCEDWTGVNNRMPLSVLPFSDCETVLIDRGGTDIEKYLEVDIVGGKVDSDAMIPLSNSRCIDFNVTSLWTRKKPTGFMYNNKWHLRHCKGPVSSNVFSCLKNRKVLLFGDSTVRQWYIHVVSNWKCTPSTEQWTKDKWHKRTACGNREHNFTVQWLPHSQPFFGADLNRYTRTSISRHLDETRNDERVIALIHLQMHTIGYHHSVFTEKMHRIRKSVESLLNRNKFAKVLIKGPHTYTHAPFGTARLSDFYGLVYRHILFEEFAGLHNRVIFLDNSDINNAMAIKENHPPGIVVGAMVDQLLAYIC